MEKLDTGTGFGEQIINRYTTGMDTLYKIEKQVQVPGTVFHIFPSNDTGTGFGDHKINRYITGMATLYKIKKQVQVPGTVFPNNFSNGPGTRYNDSLLRVPYC